ncbi:MAG: 16S rRNA (guanine(527)-N(7))-methyltransferase RsmG [Planctomycetota bacterium]
MSTPRGRSARADRATGRSARAGEQPPASKPASATPPRTWQAPLAFPSGLPPHAAPESFLAQANDLGVVFEAGDVEQLGRYLALLLEANKVINLTSVRDADEAWVRHILDALTLLPVVAGAAADETAASTTEGDHPDTQSQARPIRILDVGTGGGLPGIPLAICVPHARITLLDATEKKCRFLEHVVSELGLANVTVVHHRAEAAAHDRGRRIDSGGIARREGALRASFDVVTARAVGRLATLLELTVPFARVGGLCVLVKGAKAEEELTEAKPTLHLLHASHAGTVATSTGNIVVIEKRRDTPKMYPRASGEPKRRPLGVVSTATTASEPEHTSDNDRKTPQNPDA